MNIEIIKFFLFFYLPYVFAHKINVFIECCKIGVPILGITHDISKFSPIELYGYTIDKYKCDPKAFGYAWMHHKNNNKHHPEYWIVNWRGNKNFYNGVAEKITDNISVFEMKNRYIKEMIADWRAMGKVFGDTAEEFYSTNKSEIILHSNTRKKVEKILGLTNE